MPSKKVSHKQSITSRDQGGGPRKFGGASRATNFMIGVKTNHVYSGKPFVNKKSDYSMSP